MQTGRIANSLTDYNMTRIKDSSGFPKHSNGRLRPGFQYFESRVCLGEIDVYPSNWSLYLHCIICKHNGNLVATNNIENEIGRYPQVERFRYENWSNFIM